MTNKKTPKSVFLVMTTDNCITNQFKTLVDAQNYIVDDELEGAKILEVVAVTESWYPPEPEIEFSDGSLDDILN